MAHERAQASRFGTRLRQDRVAAALSQEALAGALHTPFDPVGQQRHVETSARLRTLLDETDFAVALAAGASMRLSDAVAEALQPPQAATRAATVSLYGLTRRERDILRLIAAGKSNQEIGDLLFISPRTLSTHITAILAKLDAPSRTAAAAAAHRLGLL